MKIKTAKYLWSSKQNIYIDKHIMFWIFNILLKLRPKTNIYFTPKHAHCLPRYDFQINFINPEFSNKSNVYCLITLQQDCSGQLACIMFLCKKSQSNLTFPFQHQLGAQYTNLSRTSVCWSSSFTRRMLEWIVYSLYGSMFCPDGAW